MIKIQNFDILSLWYCVIFHENVEEKEKSRLIFMVQWIDDNSIEVKIWMIIDFSHDPINKFCCYTYLLVWQVWAFQLICCLLPTFSISALILENSLCTHSLWIVGMKSIQRKSNPIISLPTTKIISGHFSLIFRARHKDNKILWYMMQLGFLYCFNWSDFFFFFIWHVLPCSPNPTKCWGVSAATCVEDLLMVVATSGVVAAWNEAETKAWRHHKWKYAIQLWDNLRA